jgi:hypothetical protein
MPWNSITVCAWLEMSVVLFQVFGVAALCLSRLLPGTAWAGRAKVTYVFALVGLGVAGALCGQHESRFALFAGATMTVLFIGMIAGNCASDTTAVTRARISAEPNLAA